MCVGFLFVTSFSCCVADKCASAAGELGRWSACAQHVAHHSSHTRRYSTAQQTIKSLERMTWGKPKSVVFELYKRIVIHLILNSIFPHFPKKMCLTMRNVPPDSGKVEEMICSLHDDRCDFVVNENVVTILSYHVILLKIIITTIVVIWEFFFFFTFHQNYLSH